MLTYYFLAIRKGVNDEGVHKILSATNLCCEATVEEQGEEYDNKKVSAKYVQHYLKMRKRKNSTKEAYKHLECKHCDLYL
jgi:hypothetical protein